MEEGHQETFSIYFWDLQFNRFINDLDKEVNSKVRTFSGHIQCIQYTKALCIPQGRVIKFNTMHKMR